MLPHGYLFESEDKFNLCLLVLIKIRLVGWWHQSQNLNIIIGNLTLIKINLVKK